MALHRRVLTDDTSSRQKLLEESVYDVAVARWKHEAQTFEELGLGRKGLDSADLRAWLWRWHTKLEVRIEAEVNALIKAEAKLRMLFYSSYCLLSDIVIQLRSNPTNVLLRSCLSLSLTSSP